MTPQPANVQRRAPALQGKAHCPPIAVPSDAQHLPFCPKIGHECAVAGGLGLLPIERQTRSYAAARHPTPPPAVQGYESFILQVCPES
eukprot:7718601-Pyramimonas_sp.AAC.1